MATACNRTMIPNMQVVTLMISSRRMEYWWPTPPESPDLNPIENIWGSLKQYLRNTYKPKNLVQLKEGIQQFWLTLTPEVCKRYIMHLKKVMPKVIEEGGGPSRY